MTHLDKVFEGAPEWLTTDLVAELLGQKRRTVYAWLRDGVVPGYQLGATWMVLRDELKDTLQRSANLPQATINTDDGDQGEQ